VGKLSERFEMRCNPALTDAIDQWRGAQRPIPSRAEAIRLLVARAIGAENLLGLVLLESARELIAANQIGPETSLETYERWAHVIRQSLDRVAREQSISDGPRSDLPSPHSSIQETPAANTLEPISSRATR